jgi:hypothetical protein
VATASNYTSGWSNRGRLTASVGPDPFRGNVHTTYVPTSALVSSGWLESRMTAMLHKLLSEMPVWQLEELLDRRRRESL